MFLVKHLNKNSKNTLKYLVHDGGSKQCPGKGNDLGFFASDCLKISLKFRVIIPRHY